MHAIRRLSTQSTLGLAALAIAGTVVTSPASAFLVLRLGDLNAGTVLSCDTSLGISPTNCGLGFIVTAPNSLTYTGSVGGVNITGLTASSNAPGTSASGALNLEFSGTSVVLAPLQFYADLTGLGFSLPSGLPPGPLLRATGTTTATGSGSASFRESFYGDPSNTGALLNTATCSFALPASGCTALSEWRRGSGPYSLRLVDPITLAGGSSVSVQSSLVATVVPEPPAWALIGLGLFVVLRRRYTSAVARHG